MDLGIRGRHAAVIGASMGLGLAACEALAAEGVSLTLFARNREHLERAKEELSRRHGVAVDYVVGDITERADSVRLADHLRSKGLDILVLNTPRPPSPMRDFLSETDDARWEEGYRNQLHGALNILREITPLIVERGWGRIIGRTSASVKQPMPRHAVSSVFRAGVQAALKHLVPEVGPAGVTVNVVAPATIITPTFTQNHNMETRIQAIPLRRGGRMEELGATIAFLASENAGFITGQVIQLDGGMTTSLV